MTGLGLVLGLGGLDLGLGLDNNREHGARSGDDTEQSDVKVDVTIIGIGMRNNEKER